MATNGILLITVVCVFLVFTAAGKCDPLQLEERLTWNNDSKVWEGKPDPCFQYNHDVEDTIKILKGKTILFVGDSTVRNLAQILIASLCNPDRMMNCAQRMAWPFMKDDFEHAMNCSKTTPWDDEGEPAAGEAKTTKIENWCNDPSKITFTLHTLRYLTADYYAFTRKHRKELWLRGISPAMLQINLLGVNVLVLEASCVKQNDGLHRALKWLIDYKSQVADGTLNFNVTDDKGEKPFQKSIPHWDLIVTSGGFHCTYFEYQKKPGWYGKISERLRTLKHYSPIVWLEASNCNKGHVGHMKWKGGKQEILPHKLASCEFIHSYADIIKSLMIRSGFTFSPQYFLTVNITNSTPKALTRAENELPCVFADLMHPGVKCYKQMLQVHLNSIRIALKEWVPPPPGATAYVAPTMAPRPPRWARFTSKPTVPPAIEAGQEGAPHNGAAKQHDVEEKRHQPDMDGDQGTKKVETEARPKKKKKVIDKSHKFGVAPHTEKVETQEGREEGGTPVPTLEVRKDAADDREPSPHKEKESEEDKKKGAKTWSPVLQMEPKFDDNKNPRLIREGVTNNSDEESWDVSWIILCVPFGLGGWWLTRRKKSHPTF